MKKKGRFSIVCIGMILGFLLSAGTASAARIKDLAYFLGARSNALIGYGLVVGLKNTGDSTQHAVHHKHPGEHARKHGHQLRSDPGENQKRGGGHGYGQAACLFPDRVKDRCPGLLDRRRQKHRGRHAAHDPSQGSGRKSLRGRPGTDLDRGLFGIGGKRKQRSEKLIRPLDS